MPGNDPINERNNERNFLNPASYFAASYFAAFLLNTANTCYNAGEGSSESSFMALVFLCGLGLLYSNADNQEKISAILGLIVGLLIAKNTTEETTMAIYCPRAPHPNPPMLGK